jgi:hypothetical protein
MMIYFELAHDLLYGFVKQQIFNFAAVLSG